jgi:RecA/RadA recombinase
MVTPGEVASLFKLKDHEVNELLVDIGYRVMISRQAVKRLDELAATEIRLPIGNADWNKFLEGGLPLKGLNEIVGPSGCGKTQLCLQLALTVQRPRSLGGLDGSKLMLFT